ncbi:putative serum paraoxonase arylesterase [Phaeomoniella chlamydospora]|uniref:Putative serum paraoxonase arylesterase n=1 Tax=Phaeomoniella chlamydospora TaxID=158046 RepID=A0A0G2ENM5_PHACM|nr:putative serum paraoxonase arylesterase [Phaeomoniella chlamydospora]
MSLDVVAISLCRIYTRTAGFAQHSKVPNSLKDEISILKLLPETQSFEKITPIHVGMGVDNLALDKNGDTWAAGLPKADQMLGVLKDPFGHVAARALKPFVTVCDPL